MKTPAELRALAAHLTERATEAARQRKVDVAALLLVEAADARDEAERLEGLTGKNKARKVRHTMAEVSQEHPPVRTGPGRPRKSQHAFPLALEAKGLTVAEWARARKLERSVVRSWFASKERDQRSIPGHWAREIRNEYGVPFSAWPKGLR